MKRTPLFVISIALIAAALTAASTHGRQQDQPVPKPGSREAKASAAIRAVLDAQAAAWNRGDIEGYMEGYARSMETVFISGDTVTRGWQTVLDRYKKGYDTREKMGTLSFSELEIKVVGKDTAVALGRWQLTRAGDTPRGRFTLIFRLVGKVWRIVHDHTSSAS